MGERTDTFLFHYNFPPYSVGETGMVGSPKRREIGHGRLDTDVESINEIEGIYMKLRFISSALAAALFAATGSYAAVVDGGTIHFEGELVNAACSVNTDSADQVVTLGQPSRPLPVRPAQSYAVRVGLPGGNPLSAVWWKHRC